MILLRDNLNLGSVMRYCNSLLLMSIQQFRTNFIMEGFLHFADSGEQSDGQSCDPALLFVVYASSSSETILSWPGFCIAASQRRLTLELFRPVSRESSAMLVYSNNASPPTMPASRLMVPTYCRCTDRRALAEGPPTASTGPA